MSSFEWLSEDHLLQRAMFGGKVEVVANFGGTAGSYHGTRVPPRSVLVQGKIYTPRTT
jgi:hypothetical protein